MTLVVTPAEGLVRLRAAADSGSLDALCERYAIRVLTVFGSAGRAEPQARDLDIGVFFEHGETPALLDLLVELDGVTGAENDVVHLNRAGPVLRERAFVGSVWLYESEPGALADAILLRRAVLAAIS